MEHIREYNKSNNGQLFPRIPQTTLYKNNASLYYVILQCYDGVHNVDKTNVSKLKSSFRENGNLGTIWSKIVIPYFS